VKVYPPFFTGEAKMRNVTFAAIVLSLVGSSIALSYSEGSSGCTIDQRINLGKQGYTSERVDQMCTHSESSPSAEGSKDGGPWDKLLNEFMGELGKGLGQGLFKGNDKGNNAVPPTSASPYSHSNTATMCATNYGTCPLRGIPAGASCYCRAYNGFTAYGVAR
jgi:hypothetical protein